RDGHPVPRTPAVYSSRLSTAYGVGLGMDLVTGATGFIGAHVVRSLLARDRAVRCLVRPTSPRQNIDGLPVEVAEGDLGDPASLRRGLAGIDVLYHCAADYRLWSRDPRELYRANVDGTDNVMRAAAEAGVGRVVHTSSVGALLPGPKGRPSDEDTPVSLED